MQYQCHRFVCYANIPLPTISPTPHRYPCMKHANYSYDTLSQWAEVPDDYTPLYVANKQEQGSIIPLHSSRQKTTVPPIKSIKTPEQALQELRECKEENQPVWVYIYKHTPVGYFAIYDGVICFIHHFRSGYKYHLHSEEDNLVNTWCQAEIIRIDKEEKVCLSIKKYLKAQFWHEAQFNAQHLQAGMAFNGVVKQVDDGCILLLGHQLHGLLHINEVIPKYLFPIASEIGQRYKILRSIFMLNKPVNAIINSIRSNGFVTLTWDKKLPANAAICDAICSMGIRC